MAGIDVDYARGQFPALRDVVVLLDNAGGSQVARSVAERITNFLYSTNAQLAASYATSIIAGECVDTGHAAFTLVLNAARRRRS